MTERMCGLVPDRLAPPAMRNDGIVRDVAAEIVRAAAVGQWVDPSRLAAARAVLQRHDSPARVSITQPEAAT